MSGMLKISPHVPPATPSIFSAMRRVASFPAGIHVGFGWPWPCLLVTFRLPKSPFFVYVVIELSRFCMTSAMIVRSLQFRTDSIRSILRGFFAT